MWIASLVLSLGAMAWPAWGYAEWQTLRDDDGTADSHWGFCGGPGQLLRKTFVLDNVQGVQDAILQYQMANNPYHYKAKTYPGKPVPGITWSDMLILVNGAVAKRGSPLELGVQVHARLVEDQQVLGVAVAPIRILI